MKLNMKQKLKINDTTTNYFNAVASAFARYGDNQPRGGVIYNSPCTMENGILYIDAYGYGCIQNSNLNPYKKMYLRKRQPWNAPVPKLANCVKIMEVLAKGEFRKIVLGHRSEFAPWMDHKYQITKTILGLVRQLSCGVPVEIYTSSDLIAHNDYIAAMSGIRNLRINMRMKLPKSIEVASEIVQLHYTRETEPGGPSLLRRSMAIDKLSACGFDIKRVGFGFYVKTSDLK
jgi:hypothetical protein